MDPDVEALVAPKRKELTDFYYKQLATVQPRHDYREVIELALIFLGHKTTTGEVRFRRPGAVHHARWMAKVLYVIKMWLFRSQMPFHAHDLKAVKDAAIFSVLVYLKYWMTATLAAAAPRRDFEFMHDLLHYPEKAIAMLALEKLRNHLWYLSDELVALAFFDPEVDAETKSRMVLRLSQQAASRQLRPMIPTEAFIGGQGLEQFVTERTRQFFDRLRLPDEFLNVHSSEWNGRADFD